MLVNARYIYQHFTSRGWSPEAVCAMLGNMEFESTINPGIYESLDASSSTNGFGLVQWTPNTKYKTWADEQGFAYSDMDGQLARIQYEVDNELQWIETDRYPMSFKTFTTSTDDVAALTMAFLHNYERPANLDQPDRAVEAVKWYATLSGYTPDVPDQPSSETRKMSKLLFYYAGLRR